jgi:hypothetical protein
MKKQYFAFMQWDENDRFDINYIRLLPPVELNDLPSIEIIEAIDHREAAEKLIEIHLDESEEDLYSRFDVWVSDCGDNPPDWQCYRVTLRLQTEFIPTPQEAQP